MGPVNVSFHLLRTQEWIIDERIDAGGVMNIQNRGAHLADILKEIITVEVTFPPLLVGVDRTEGSDRHVEIIIQILALLNLPVPGIRVDKCPAVP